MELISHIANATFPNSKIEEQFRFENLASKQKTFRIVKEQQLSQRITVQKSVVTESNGKTGGANRDRTGDLLLAKQALSQLSYGP
jgi:hypothetical protein